MKLIQNYLTKSGCYQAGRKITVKGLMIHSVGCPQPKAFFIAQGRNIRGKILKIALDYPAELCYSIYRTKKCRPLVLLGYQT